MELKRRTGPDGCITHVDVVHTGTHEAQNWGAKHVAAWVEEGWMRVDGDSIVIVTGDGQPDLVYTINRRPGYYCAETGERVPLSDLALTQFMSQSLATLAPRGVPAVTRAVTSDEAWRPTVFRAAKCAFALHS